MRKRDHTLKDRGIYRFCEDSSAEHGHSGTYTTSAPTRVVIMRKTFLAPTILALVVGVSFLQGCANHTVAVWSENEAWVTGPEGITNYSNGLQVTLSPTTPHAPCADDCDGQAFRRFVYFINILEAKDASPNNEIWLRYGLAQQFFTPDDITIPTLQPDDRPYAGWLSESLDIVNESLVSNTNGNDRR